MREIKFRAWAKGLRKFFYGNAVTISLDGEVLKTYGVYDTHLELSQFTGLHDKNGKEIYEGDIVTSSVFPTESNPMGEPDMGKIEFRCGAFGISYEEAHFESFCSLYGDSGNAYEETVIGNIYENPELLREAAK